MNRYTYVDRWRGAMSSTQMLYETINNTATCRPNCN